MQIIRPAPITTAALAASSVPDAIPAWTPGSTYALGEHVQDPATHREYESLQAGNISHALTDPAWWLDLGATNRWRMFDQTIGSQTVAENQLQVDLLISSPVDAVALFNTNAGAAQIVAKVGATVVYDKTVQMTSTSGITDWNAYFFEPIERRSDLIVTDLPTHSNMAITIRLTQPGGTVKVGTLVVGQVKDIGMTLAGMSASIVDYSRKGADDFGNYLIVERAFAKKLDVRVVVDNAGVDGVVSALAQLRATPVVWLADSVFTAAAVFGFYRNFSVTFDYLQYSTCLLEIEGLT